MRRLATVLTVFVLAGCSGSDSGASAEALETALVDAGLEFCETNEGPGDGQQSWTLGSGAACDEGPVDLDSDDDLFVGDARVLYSEDGPHPGVGLSPEALVEWDWDGATISLGFGASPEAEAAIDGLGAERLGEGP